MTYSPSSARRRPDPRRALLAIACATAAVPGVQAATTTDELQSRLRWVTLSHGHKTLDAPSRLLLARSAAQQANLSDVGLDYRDVYGVIHAESSWVARPGMGKNGVVSHGLAQFEPATARAVGLHDPADPVAAVHAAAKLLKEAAHWSALRLEGLNLEAAQRARKLREGVSVYYNLSSRGRQAWQGHNSHRMPIETRLHIRNVQDGAARAGQLTGNPTEAVAPLEALRAVAVPSIAAVPVRVALATAPRPTPMSAWIRGKDSITTPEGSIRWSRQ